MTREERKKAIDALKISAPIHALTEEEFNDYIQTLNKVMDWLEQEPKTGYWIRGHHGFECSNCHESVEGKWDDNIDDITGTLFCPNCGAKMIEPQESEEV